MSEGTGEARAGGGSKRYLGLVILLVCSELIGLGAGHWFFEVFKTTVPPAAVSDFMRASAYAYFVAHGLGLGFVIFIFTLVAILLRRFLPVSGDSRPAAPR